MDQSKPVALLQHSAKVGFGLIALIILAFITSDIHTMALCMMKTPIDWVQTPPPSAKLNCTTRYFRYDLSLKVQVCNERESDSVTFYLNDDMLRSFSAKESTDLIDWLRRCSGPAHGPSCPLFSTGYPDCPSYTPFSLTDYICHHNATINLVINKVRFMKKESNEVMLFLLQTR